MQYKHSFKVDASLAAVIDFHRHSASMGAITPPPVIVNIHRAPKVLSEGDEMEFTMWLGPLPIRWLARIENVTENSFEDRQVQGPFTKWVHRHTFVPVYDAALGKEVIEVQDTIDAELSNNWFWKIVGLGMWSNMFVLFAFRGWKTKRILQQTDVNQVAA